MASSASAESLLWALKRQKKRHAHCTGRKLAPYFLECKSRSNEGPDNKSKIAMEPLINAASLLKLAKEEAMWLFGTDDASAISAVLPKQPDVVVTNGTNLCNGVFTDHRGS